MWSLNCKIIRKLLAMTIAFSFVKAHRSQSNSWEPSTKCLTPWNFNNQPSSLEYCSERYPSSWQTSKSRTKTTSTFTSRRKSSTMTCWRKLKLCWTGSTRMRLRIKTARKSNLKISTIGRIWSDKCRGSLGLGSAGTSCMMWSITSR